MFPFQKTLKRLLNGYNFYQELFRDKMCFIIPCNPAVESLSAKRRDLGTHLGLCPCQRTRIRSTHRALGFKKDLKIV